MLYIVATPIGNLGDMSPRAVDTLKSVDLIAAEDTRHTIKLLNHFQIHTSLTSLHEHNEPAKGQLLVNRMLEEGINMALVTDAGTPAVSDPGAVFVQLAARSGIEVLAVPGPSAAIAALSVSGFDRQSFTFYGFLSRKASELLEQLKHMAGKDEIAILHESPMRIKKLMEAVIEALGDVAVSLSCDITKLHELTLRGSASQVLQALNSNDKAEKGEYVLVLDLFGLEGVKEAAREELALEARLLHWLLEGDDMRSACARLTHAGERKNAVYAASLKLKDMMREDVSKMR
ncbi:MAG: 16S rRNA (cytidine(1402)-2'-O)-methyltransferase [Clostridia bacterium]|nr:16S rRNA (cytidine(1402)-2'-O)-methyltransferase [Clostridia bacterium]